ncbi:MAG: hypothetical protein JWO66_974, partial [Candidatus Eremiobacteraeota bacterium]|nr:hypothetical protein [Candidatus Eremiobacteraeota bacterium]
MFTLSARVVPPVLFTRRGRALRTHSAVGLAALSDQERRTGRVLVLDLLGVSWFSRGIYLDSFYGTIDDEYAAFAALPFPRDDKKAIAPRVAAAIRTIALFSAWYPVIWRFVARGFIASVVAALVAAVWVALAALGPHPSALAVVFAAGLTFLALVVAGRLVLRLPRRWPRDVLTLVVAGAACATLAQILFAHRPPSWPWPGVLAAATAVAVVCLVNAAVLTVAQAL